MYFYYVSINDSKNKKVAAATAYSKLKIEYGS